MSGVNTITLNYQEYKSYVKNNKNSKLANRSYSMEMSGSTDSEGKLIGNTVYTDIGTGVTYEMKAAYDKNFTSDTPLIKVTAKDTNGRQQAYLVNIDEVDVSDASDIELFALCSYADAHEKRTEGAKSSWDLLKGYVKENALDEGYDQKRDWLTMVGNAKDECMEAKLYKQVTDGNKLTQLLEKYGMPKEVEMIRIDDNTLVPVENGIFVQDVDGGYAQMLFDKSGAIQYVNNLNKSAGWSMEVSQEMLKKAQELGSEYALYMSDQTFWESYLNGDTTIDELRAATDYKAIRADFFAHLPESVRQAWEQAAAESGTDGLGIDENGEFEYPSEFLKQHMLAKLKGENTAFYGSTADSVLEFAKRTLSQLQDSNQPVYNVDFQTLKNKEILFYQNLIKQLE